MEEDGVRQTILMLPLEDLNVLRAATATDVIVARCVSLALRVARLRARDAWKALVRKLHARRSPPRTGVTIDHFR